MLSKAEFFQITREILPKVFIPVPPECIIVRVKDVIEILEYFTEREKPNEQEPTKRVLHDTDGDPAVGQSVNNVSGNGDIVGGGSEK